MMWEILIIAVLLIIIFSSNKLIDVNQFVKDNNKVFNLLKEDDYDFLVKAKYGDGLDANKLFEKRVKDSLLILVVVFFISISSNFKTSYIFSSFLLSNSTNVFK